jgi:drug/metabolite transporter (DMT)-like permease
LIKKSLIGLTPVQVGALRILITAFTLIAIGFKQIFKIKKRHWLYIFLTSILGTFFPAFLFAFAIQGIDSSITSILNSLTPLNTLLIGALIFSFAFKKHQLIGILVGLTGTILLILKGAELNPNQNYWYALLPILSSIGYAFNVNILKKYLYDLNALSITVGNFIILIIPTSIVLWYSNFFQSFELTSKTESSLIYISILAIFGTAFAKTLFNRLVQISSPIFSSSVTYLIPIVAVFWGVLDHENLSFYQLSGGFLIFLGVYLTNRS